MIFTDQRSILYREDCRYSAAEYFADTGGALGMVLGDTIFIYALNKIGANRVAIVDSFSPLVIYSYSIILLPNQSLTIVQIIGFIITILGLLILTYENDYDDIDYKVKRFGILLVLGAMACTGLGGVYLKTVLKFRKQKLTHRK